MALFFTYLNIYIDDIILHVFVSNLLFHSLLYLLVLSIVICEFYFMNIHTVKHYNLKNKPQLFISY